MLLRIVIAVALFVSSSFAKSPTGSDNTLVIVDSSIVQEDFKDFFQDLQERGHTLSIKDVRDTDFQLLEYGVKSFDNLLIFPTKSKALGPKLTSALLLDFFNAGGNIFAITSPQGVTENVRDFFSELDIAISRRDYKLVDHFHYSDELSPHDHELVVVTAPQYVTPSVATHGIESVWYKGSGAYLGNNKFVVPILRAPSTAYVYDTIEDDKTLSNPWVSGAQTYLSAGFQGLNNARALWVGSLDLFSQELFEKDTGNRQFAEDVSKWVFQEKNVIKPVFIEHFLTGSNMTNEKLYKVNEEINYLVALSEWKDDKWVPFIADDIQLEFIMLDPYYRLTLKQYDQRSDYAIYSTTFDIPDQHGMFTFKLDYLRPGLSFIQESDVVAIRHIANDEWPRSWEITNSWVYLTSAVTVVIAWIVFVILYLYTDETKAGKQGKIEKQEETESPGKTEKQVKTTKGAKKD